MDTILIKIHVTDCKTFYLPDCSIQRTKNSYAMDRRLVIQRIAMGTSALVLVPGLIASCEKAKYEILDPHAKGPVINNDLLIDLTLPANAALNSQGGSKVINGIIVINLGASGFAALASACTHEGTQVSYSTKSNNLQCPNHGSVFSLTGSVLNGPAIVPLKKYFVSKNGNILTVRE